MHVRPGATGSPVCLFGAPPTPDTHSFTRMEMQSTLDRCRASTWVWDHGSTAIFSATTIQVRNFCKTKRPISFLEGFYCRPRHFATDRDRRESLSINYCCSMQAGNIARNTS